MPYLCLNGRPISTFNELPTHDPTGLVPIPHPHYYQLARMTAKLNENASYVSCLSSKYKPGWKLFEEKVKEVQSAN